MIWLNHNGGSAKQVKRLQMDQATVELMPTAEIPEKESVLFKISQTPPINSTKMAKIDWTELLVLQVGERFQEILTKNNSMIS